MEPQELDTQEVSPDTETVLHTWEIASRDDEQKDQRFYMGFFAIMVALLVFAIWQKNFLFGVFVVFAAGTMLYISSEKPRVHTFSLTDTRLIIGDEDHSYSYERLSHFDFYEFSPTDTELLIVFKERLRPTLRIRVFKKDRQKIGEIFVDHMVPRKLIEPSLTDIISKALGI